MYFLQWWSFQLVSGKMVLYKKWLFRHGMRGLNAWYLSEIFHQQDNLLISCKQLMWVPWVLTSPLVSPQQLIPSKWLTVNDKTTYVLTFWAYITSFLFSLGIDLVTVACPEPSVNWQLAITEALRPLVNRNMEIWSCTCKYLKVKFLKWWIKPFYLTCWSDMFSVYIASLTRAESVMRTAEHEEEHSTQQRNGMESSLMFQLLDQ